MDCPPIGILGLATSPVLVLVWITLPIVILRLVSSPVLEIDSVKRTTPIITVIIELIGGVHARHWSIPIRSQVIVPTVVWVSRSLAKCIGTPHGIGILEIIGVVKTRTGLTSEVGYPYLEIMVIAKVPVEVVLVAPIWGHCGIQSQVKVVITPGVVVRPIIAHIHILVVVEALSGLIGLESGISV